MTLRTAGIVAAIILGAAAGFGPAVPGLADPLSPFERLAGRWVGEGRLGARSGDNEAVRCRASYRTEKGGMELRQAIRCASLSGSIEVQSHVSLRGNVVSGTWREVTRNWSGQVTGIVHHNGFKVAVKGENISANMDIVANESRQIIEIQFLDTAFVGLTLVLTKE